MATIGEQLGEPWVFLLLRRGYKLHDHIVQQQDASRRGGLLVSLCPRCPQPLLLLDKLLDGLAWSNTVPSPNTLEYEADMMTKRVMPSANQSDSKNNNINVLPANVGAQMNMRCPGLGVPALSSPKPKPSTGCCEGRCLA
jgi:hypothetical protein